MKVINKIIALACFSFLPTFIFFSCSKAENIPSDQNTTTSSSSSSSGIFKPAKTKKVKTKSKINDNVPKAKNEKECIACIQIFIECPEGYVRIPQSCDKCAHCEKIENGSVNEML